jgi:hypothetical protein
MARGKNLGVNVLAGDVNGHGMIDADDFLQVRRRLAIVRPAVGLHSAFVDVNGDGEINALDLAWARCRQAESLPAVR